VPDRNVIHIDVPLRHDLLEITQAERISQITTNAQNDDFWSEMSPLEQRWPLRPHEGPSLTDQLRHFCNTLEKTPPEQHSTTHRYPAVLRAQKEHGLDESSFGGHQTNLGMRHAPQYAAATEVLD
jgi:hypothetical protein